VLLGEDSAAHDIEEMQKIKTFEPIRFTSA